MVRIGRLAMALCVFSMVASAQISPHHPGDTISVGWVDQNGASHSATVKLATGPVA